MQRRDSGKTGARELVERLNAAGRALCERVLIAPVMPGGRIRTRIEGLVYEFRLSERFVGWGRFRPLNARVVEPAGEALPWQRGAYLELFPALRVILLWPDESAERPGVWWATPFNESDAHQRFGFRSGEPLPVLLCDPLDGAQRFARVVVRVDGHTLWFDRPDLLADPQTADFLRDTADRDEAPERLPRGLAASERSTLLFWRLHRIELRRGDERRRYAELRGLSRRDQEAWLRQSAERSRLEAQLRHALDKADATLRSFDEVLNSDGTLAYLLVEWSERGAVRRNRTTLTPDLTLVSSGICLQGREHDFDLTSFVNVLAESPWNR